MDYNFKYEFDRIDIDPDAIARGEQSAAELLKQHPLSLTRKLHASLSLYRFHPPLIAGDSRLGDLESEVRRAGFKPIAFVCVMMSPDNILGVELWPSDDAKFVLEIGHSPVPGQHYALATYFEDGTQLVMWRDGEHMEMKAGDRREQMAGTQDILLDIERFRTRLNELIAQGKRPIPCADIHNYKTRVALHQAFFMAIPVIHLGFKSYLMQLVVLAAMISVVVGALWGATFLFPGFSPYFPYVAAVLAVSMAHFGWPWEPCAEIHGLHSRDGSH